MEEMTRPCPLCNAESRPIWEGPRSAYLCTGCQSGWMATRDAAHPPCGDAEGPRWSDAYFEQNYRPRAAALLNYFRAQIERLPLGASRGRWLDVGCGCGYFAAAALEHGWQVTGVDPSPAALRMAQTVAPEAELCCGTSAALPAGAEYDVISFWDSVGHIPDLDQELPRYLEHLAPGGKLIVKTPHRPPRVLRTAQGLLSWRPALRDDLVYARITHWHFTPRSLGYALERFGMSIVGHRWEREVPDPGAGLSLSPRALLREAAEQAIRWAAGPHASFVLVAQKS